MHGEGVERAALGGGVSLATVHELPVERVREHWLTYEQLRVFLSQRGYGDYSARWLRYRRAEGMPHVVDFAGRVRFLPSQVIPWLEARRKR